jgi:Mce-associated membrane protein
MPPRKRTSSVLNGDADVEPDDIVVSDPSDALSLAEEAEAEAAEADAIAAAARARARALRLRRQAKAATAAAGTSPGTASTRAAQAPVVAETAEVQEADVTELDVPAVDDTVDGTVADDGADAEPTETDGPSDADTADEIVDIDEAADAEPTRRRRLKLPRMGLKFVAASLVTLLSLGLFGAGGWMIWHHHQVVAQQQRSAEFVAAARQGVVTLMSLDFNHAEDDVKRIIDNTTGDFRKEFESQAPEFTDVAKQSKVVTEATVNAAAVQSMTKDTATVLVAVTTRVSNTASKQQEPRSWRLSVDVARDGGQIKLAKVEFVP